MKIEPRGKYKYVKRGLEKETTEHRHVLHLLDPRENEQELVVHHIDGDKGNNKPENLTWMTKSDHMRLHHLGENHFPCDGERNANYRHGMCVNGQSKEYKCIHNKKTYLNHRKERLAKQNAYAVLHREHKRWLDKINYWKRQLEIAGTEERRNLCIDKISFLKENAV